MIEILKVLDHDTPTLWLPAGRAPEFVPQTESVSAHWLVEFHVVLAALPYLADHGFHDMIVLPGAFHIELARQVHRQIFQQDALNLSDIEFEQPVILTDDLKLTVRAEQRPDGRVAYALFEGTSEFVRESLAPQSCARMLVDVNLPAPGENGPSAHFDSTTSAEDFYRQLRGNGNQYGPSFQTFANISQTGLQATGQFVDTAGFDGGVLTPPLLDAAAQLLSAFAVDRGRTFILKSIKRLAVSSLSSGRPSHAHASLTNVDEADRPELLGAVQVVDANGALLWELSGVALAFIEPPAIQDSSSLEETRLCVAATFTAEPLADSLRFWGSHFSRPVQVEFAPYNQVFQQLLDPTSAFHQNRDGINLLALHLEDWARDDHPTLPAPDPARAAACFGERSRTTLPNGLEIVQLNAYETDYVYQEIFEDESYLRHGIELPDGATVIDIGANIGLFSLFVLSRCQNPAIYSYEPSPRVFDLLRANCAAYGNPSRVHAFNFGVAEKKGLAQFTFYESSSVFSSFHPDEREDRAAVQAVVRNVLQDQLPVSGGVEESDVQELTTNRLRAQTIECQLTSVSDIIRENDLTRIHLLKIDAEKSEIGILRGIDEAHWPMIEQIVMEVHDRTRSAVKAIEDQLTERGFRCAVVEEKLLTDSGLFNVFATRPDLSVNAVDVPKKGLQSKVEEFCSALDSFSAATSTPLILTIAPRAKNVAAANAAEDQLIAHAARHRQIRAMGSQEIRTRYPVHEMHDAHSRQLGHMPFTPEGYTALGTAFSRAIFQLSARPIKVIALDCDNTLWQGQCGEDGPAGVQITAPFRQLQEFMIAQHDAGVLLVLCSKNTESDALAVFERHAEMPLRREHLAGWQINWNTKPENLRALAAQLNLGLKSFVFLDDNPVECAAVRAGCPEVLVVQLPSVAERIPAFLESLWIFDRAVATREDRERSQWYRANAEREEQRTAAPTLRDFLDGLELQIEVAEAADEQLDRVAQLTVRTNQFNLTSIRRSEAEIRSFLVSGATCLVTSVRDRFGDYGLVGAILYTAALDRLVVDTLLLSCRALGKGVEHRMLAELASRAVRNGNSIVELSYRQTDRNEPAREFLERLAASPVSSDLKLELSAEQLAELRYEPGHQLTACESGAKGNALERQSIPARANLSTPMQRLGDEFASIDAILAAIERSERPAPQVAEPELPQDASALEHALTAIWKKALGRTQIGLHENFFDAGGTSLKAVVVIASIRKELKKNVSIIALFECPTIALLAARLDDSAGPDATATAAAESADSRGRQRRNKLIKRRAA